MKVLNFGSLNVDYVYQVDHFVRKGETLASSELKTYCGGKGVNQSLALQRAGVSVIHAGAVGTDGTALLKMLSDSGVDVSHVYQLTQVRTGNAIIQNDRQGDNSIILYGGANQAIEPDMVDKVLKDFTKGDCIILQNEISSINAILQRAHEKGIKVVLNPSPIDVNILNIDSELVDLLMLNEVEAQAFVGEQTGSDTLLNALKMRFPTSEIVLTLGEEGAACMDVDGCLYYQPAFPVPVKDTTAAGDTFTGYYLSQRLHGESPKRALEVASRASAITVSRKGASVSIPWMEEVMQYEKGAWIP